MRSRHALTRKEFLRYLSGAPGYFIVIAKLPFVAFKPDSVIPTGTYIFPQGLRRSYPSDDGLQMVFNRELNGDMTILILNLLSNSEN